MSMLTLACATGMAPGALLEILAVVGLLWVAVAVGGLAIVYVTSSILFAALGWDRK